MTLRWLWEAGARPLLIQSPVIFDTNFGSLFWMPFGAFCGSFRGLLSLKHLPVGALLSFFFRTHFWPRFGSPFVFTLSVGMFFIICTTVPKPTNPYSSGYKADFSSPKTSFRPQLSVSCLVSFWEWFFSGFVFSFGSIGAPFWSLWHNCSFSFGCPFVDKCLESILNDYNTKNEPVKGDKALPF